MMTRRVPILPDYEGLYDESGRHCGQEEADGWVCTRHKGHTGVHVAHTTGPLDVICAWVNHDAYLDVDEGL